VTADVLVRLSEISPEPVALRQLARTLGVPRSTLHRVLQTLKGKGMVDQIEGAGYVIGEVALGLGGGKRLRELPHLAEPVLDDVYRQIGETVNLAIPHADSMLVVAARQSSEPLRMVSVVGEQNPFHCSGLGKAYLASLEEEAVRRLLPRLRLTPETPRTIVERSLLLQELEATRRRGFALDDEESVDGVRCVAAAIHAHPGPVVGALSVSAPVSRFDLETINRLGPLIARAAASISALLGAPPATTPSA
jgi:DNA-binding IclR family transcriptional regulator